MDFLKPLFYVSFAFFCFSLVVPLSSNPIGASGMIRFGEAALQVMGLAEDHQVEDAKVAMGHAYGGAAQFFAMWIVSSSLD